MAAVRRSIHPHPALLGRQPFAATHHEEFVVAISIGIENLSQTTCHASNLVWN
jgi:hypothetical protein